MKKLYILSATLLALLITSHASGQVSEDWVARYNGPGNKYDQGRVLVVDNAGNVYVTGRSEERKGNQDIATVKYSPAGAQLWVARYNGFGSGSDIPYAMVLDASGNVYVTGGSEGNGTGQDYVTIKYNNNGAQQWAERYNGPANLTDFAKDVKVDGDGNVYVTGYCDGATFNTSHGNAIVTLKYNPAGGLPEWIARVDAQPNIYDGSGYNPEGGNVIGLDAAGNVYVAGFSHLSGQSGSLLLKYDNNGQGQWQRSSGGDRQLAVDINNDIIVSGWDSKTSKFNSSGDLLWESTYVGPSNSTAAFWDMALDAAGNIYLTGNNNGNGTGTDYITVKYNSAGSQQWTSRYNGSANEIDLARSIAVDADGNAYVTGFSTAKVGRKTTTYYATVKYSSASGNQDWLAEYKGPESGGSGAFSIAVSGSGTVYVTGESNAKLSYFDYATVKYTQGNMSRSIQTMPLSETAALFQLKNYPNPFTQNTTIEYQLPKEAKVSLRVYDLLGQEVATLVNENKAAGSHRVNFSAKKLLPGPYFYRIQTGEFVESRKLIIVK